MAKLVEKRTTATITEEIEIVPKTPGETKDHRFMTVGGYGTYREIDGKDKNKPKINLNAKWLAEAGFDVGEKIDVEVHENELVITGNFACGHSESGVRMINPSAALFYCTFPVPVITVSLLLLQEPG